MNPKDSSKTGAKIAQELMHTENQQSKPTTTGKPRFQTSTVSVSDIPKQERLGRKSAWQYLINQVKALGKNSKGESQVLTFIVQEQNEISSLRASCKKANIKLTTRIEYPNPDNKDTKIIRVYCWQE